MAFDQLDAEAFWRDLAPGLTLQPTPGTAVSMLRPDAAGTAVMLEVFDREGYIRMPHTQEREQIGQLAKLVSAVRAAGLPPVFAFVYEEMWRPFWRLGPVLDCLLRGRHAVMPNLWAWHVDPTKGEAGWGPHRDRSQGALYSDVRPKAVSMWIPLTDATPLNGCMYVVPKHLDPDYRDEASNAINGSPADVRAVPATPGDTLVWTQSLIHWGGRTSVMAAGPRLSMSVEFQRADVPALAGFFMKPAQPLTFEQKLALIGNAIVKYKHFAPLDAAMTRFGQRWHDRVPDVFGAPPNAIH